MKKENNSNTGIRKQLMSGAVYIALAVTVVAVTVSTITATFSDGKDGNNNLSGKDSQYGGQYELNLPDVRIPDVIPDTVPDTAVSDIKQGVDAKVTEPEPEVKQDKGTAEKSEADVQNKDAGALHKLTEPEAKEAEPDKKKPVSEEPAEETFELGYGGFVKPCTGYISKEFSIEVPVYSATMYDYRTHAGVDIACDIGTPVKAVTNGYILDIYDDYMYGKTVVIEHADGIHSVYSNLSPDLPAETVTGRSVMTGEIIGGVGDSALCEVSEVSHLHFEMLKDGTFVNPEDYIN